MAAALASLHAPGYQIRFPSLFQSGRGMAFPCDGTGSVDLDALSERGRNNYLFAPMIGREFGCRVVCAS